MPVQKRPRRKPRPQSEPVPEQKSTKAQKRPRRLSAVERIVDASALTHRKILFFGPSGSGKTSLLGSANFDERTTPILVCDFEGGSSVLSGSGVQVARIRDWQDYTEIYAYLAGGDHPYKSVGVDSISETHVYALLNIVEDAVKNVDNRNDVLEIQRQDYGKAMVQLRRFLRAWRDLEMHVFLTSLPKDAPEPRVGTVQKPALFGAMAEEVVGMFDASIYVHQHLPKVSPSQRKAGIVPTSKYMAVLHGDPALRARVKVGWNQTIPEDVEIIRQQGITNIFDALQIPE